MTAPMVLNCWNMSFRAEGWKAPAGLKAAWPLNDQNKLTREVASPLGARHQAQQCRCSGTATGSHCIHHTVLLYSRTGGSSTCGRPGLGPLKVPKAQECGWVRQISECPLEPTTEREQHLLAPGPRAKDLPHQQREQKGSAEMAIVNARSASS